MKEFNIVNGKRVHPYVRTSKINPNTKRLAIKKQKQRIAQKPIFVPPYPLTLMKDTADERDFQMKNKPGLFNLATNSSLPIAIDYTLEMSRVKSQGDLGACVGFAVAAMKEWQENKEHIKEVKEGKKDHRKGKEYDYSEAWIYWNCKKIDSWPGEEGTSIRAAMYVLNRIGVPTEKAWPYSDNKLDIGNPAHWSTLIAKWALIGTYYKVNNVEEAKIALFKDGPFIMGIFCFYDFFFPVNGFIKDPLDGEQCYGGHAVCVVGFDDKTRRIKFKNSWSKYWGQSGYGYISYDYFNKYSDSNWACKDVTVTKEMLKEGRTL